MKFDQVTHKVDIETMNKDEARAFVKFLESEIWRHWDDILDARKLIKQVKEEHELY